MSSSAWYMPAVDKVSIVIGRRRVLASWEDAAELLAELQVVFDERMLNDPDGEKDE